MPTDEYSDFKNDKIYRTAKIFGKENGISLAQITDLQDGRIFLEIFDQGGVRTGWIKTNRKKFLDMFISLWPEEVAYQFIVEDE